MCPLATSMIMSDSLLLWWTLDSVTTATSRNQVESCERSSAMEIWAASTSAKLRQSNRTDKRIDFTMLVAWPAEKPTGPQGYAYVQCSYFIRVEHEFRSKNIWLGENC